MSWSTRAAAASGLLSIAVLLAGTAPAWAVGEEEWQLSLAGSFARLSADGRAALGGSVAAEGHYGLSDAWALRLAVASSWHAAPGDGARPDGTVRASTVTGGMTYAVDVLRLVPFVDLGVAVLDLGGEVTAAQRALGFEVGLGIEYLLTRRWALAMLGRYQNFPIELDGTGPTPSLFAVGFRLGRIF